MTRTFIPTAAVRGEEPLLLGCIGPPGGGKTLSALKLAAGIQRVRSGPIVVIDTEGGRSRKYCDQIPFEIIEVDDSLKSHEFLDAINGALAVNPAAVIVDSMSDEHLNYLAWHDELVPMFAGNSWAAYGPPVASRKKLLSAILKIKTPLIFTFRAREKTKQEKNEKGKTEIVNIGWQPIAPLEIVHTLDLTCILPARAEGVPVWKSEKAAEDFVIKLPRYLAPFITDGHALNEDMGEAFAKWAKGDTTDHIQEGHQVAESGTAALTAWWKKLPVAVQKSMPVAEREKMKATAQAVSQPENAV